MICILNCPLSRIPGFKSHWKPLAATELEWFGLSLLNAKKRRKKKKVPYLSLFCLKLSVLLHSQTVSLWLVETVIREKRFFERKKKKKPPPTHSPQSSPGKEWGRLTGNIRYHELQWPRRQRCKGDWSLLAFRAQRSSAQGRGGTRAGRGGGPCRSRAVYTRRQLSSFLAHSSSLSRHLFACVLSCFLQPVIVRMARLLKQSV